MFHGVFIDCIYSIWLICVEVFLIKEITILSLVHLSPLQRLFASHVSQKTTCTSEPYVRNGGCGVICEGKLFVWGGHTDIKSKIGGMTYLPCTESNAFDVWDTMTQIWSHQPTCGDVPELGLGSSLTSYSRCLYLYGGWINYGKDVFSGDIYRISLDAFKWEMIPVPPASTTTIKPSPRYATGVILFDDKLCMFGGVGPNIVEHQDPGAEWVKAVNQDSGWNNEYYEFDLKNGTRGMHLTVCYCIASFVLP